VSVVETSGDQTQLLSPLPGVQFSSRSASAPTTITVNDARAYQPMAGFGATMTDASAYMLMTGLSATARQSALTDLFDPASGIGLDYVRIPIGGNDFSQKDYSQPLSTQNNYTEDDPPSSDPNPAEYPPSNYPADFKDPQLAYFSIKHDLLYLIPVLKAMRAINPQIKIIASPWTPPVWMKCSHPKLGPIALGCIGPGKLDGGGLLRGDESLYASYLVKFIQAYAAQGIGIPISALTVQNEPLNSTAKYPSMSMRESQEQTVAGDVAEDLKQAGLSTQVLGLDHNWQYWQSYAKPLLQNQPAVAGTAFHCYTGSPGQQGQLEALFPTRGIYEDECTPLGGYTFAQDLVNNTLTEGIEGVQNWSRTVMFWNMTLNSQDGPTINKECTSAARHPCLPIMQVAGGLATRQVGYYVLGQLSKFVQAGAARVCSFTSIPSAPGSCP
jgi:glucosylceramidase